jgi:hypothetical protein
MRQPARYVLSSSSAGLATEIYFPKRAAYQGAIFDALRQGFFERQVIDYLSLHAAALLEELSDWQEILDPFKYSFDSLPQRRLTEEDARQRIAMYRSVFKGYSLYTVDGVFFSEETQTVYEETTQVVRLTLRFESELERRPEHAHRRDLVRSLSYWLIDYDARLDYHFSWAPEQKERFLAEHQHWPGELRDYVAVHFEGVAKEVEKWIDDCGLFIFGFVVRQFAENVVRQHMTEEQIWVVNSFDPCINIVCRKPAAP